MENIADALKMAAGVMIALMLLSLLLFAFTIISKNENAKKDREITKESTEFNKKFLAFDKSSMYGTDVISILGLAISNNETYKQKVEAYPDGSFVPDVDGTINIEFSIIEPVTAITRVYNYVREWNTTTRKYDVEWVEDESKKTTTTIFEENRTFSLASGPYFEKIRKIAIEGNSTLETKTRGHVKTVTDGSGFGDLKKRIFTCTEIDYNNTGKINYMKFEEKTTTP